MIPTRRPDPIFMGWVELVFSAMMCWIFMKSKRLGWIEVPQTLLNPTYAHTYMELILASLG